MISHEGTCTPKCAEGYVVYLFSWLDEVLKCSQGVFHPPTFTCVIPSTIPAPGIKRGIAIGFWRDAVMHLKLYDPKTTGWWYNWKGNVSKPDTWEQPENKGLLTERNFVPMIKERSSLQQDYLDGVFVGSPYLLAFNEPYGPVVNISARETVESWPTVRGKAEQLKQASGKNVEIVSPTVAPKEEGFEWVDEFVPLMETHGVDFAYLSVHYYTCEAKRLKRELDNLYVTFGKPIWLTEFNCGDGPRNASLAEHMEYMKLTLPMLERHPYVVRYAWMASTAPVIGASLVDEKAKALTPLGHFYNTHWSTNMQPWGHGTSGD
jgi:hypothetical protein